MHQVRYVPLPLDDEDDNLFSGMDTDEFSGMEMDNPVSESIRPNAEILAERRRQGRAKHNRRCRNREFLPMENLNFRYDPKVDLSEFAYIGKMDEVCPHCSALKFRGEPPGLCCNNGKVSLPVSDPLPSPFDRLFSEETPESVAFCTMAKAYNQAFQMTSFGASKIVREDGFRPTFKIQG